MHTTDRLACLAALLPLAVLAPRGAVGQSGAPFAVVRRPAAVDSGFLDANTSGGDECVFRTELQETGANSMRVLFGDSNVPAGSTLRLTGLRDGAVQRFDARSLTDWDDASAVFNGDRVRLELIAASGTRANRVVVTAIEVGLAVPVVETDDLCGTDDRVGFGDPRIGRQYPYGCTVWLANEFTLVTAGHCSSDPNQQVHFNVPPSDASGLPRFPSPDDQYPFDVPSLQRLDGGVGADWTVVRAVPNSNTGLYPGQAQGDWFPFGTVPSVASGNVRVTGYGVVSDPTRLTESQTEESDVGPLSGISVDTVVHGCDTEAGSSGSPVIDVATGRVIGVHTHGNCAFGGNIGTRIDRPDLQQALAATMASKVLGRVRRFGQGCATSAGPLGIDLHGYPAIGQTTQLDVGPIPSGGVAALGVGLSDQTWAGGTLPAPIPVASGCTLFVSLDASAFWSASGSTAIWSWPVPADPTLVGQSIGVQGFAFEPFGAGFRLAASDALWLTVGRDP